MKRKAIVVSILMAALFLNAALLVRAETLLMFKNPSNSAPRVISVWGGALCATLVMKSDGTAWNCGQTPSQIVGPGGAGYLAPVTAIMEDEWCSFALKPDGTVWSWGINMNFGMLGDGTTNAASSTPVQVINLTSVVSLGGRGYHSLAVKADGTIWSWGCNQYGEMGNGTISTGTGSNGPVQVVGLTNPVCVSGGGFFSLALMPNGTVRSWGDNRHGSCGDGTTNNRSLPVQVLGLTNITAISGGWFHAMALKADGTAWAWGENGHGECGNGATNQVLSPVQVIGLSNVVSFSAGDSHSTFLLPDGTVWKCGQNDMGELGLGTNDVVAKDGYRTCAAHPLAAPVPGLSNVVLAVARDYHNNCVKRDGTVWYWGDNRGGGMFATNGCPTNTVGDNTIPAPRLMNGFPSNNVIACSASFESYTNGFSMVGSNLWSADTSAMAVVATNNYTNSYNGTFPMPGPHQKVLQITGAATNRFCPSFYTNVWVDLILECKHWANSALPTADTVTNSQFALCITTNRHLAVWNCTNAATHANGWTELLDTDVASGQYCRLTIQAEYQTNGAFCHSVWLNGIASTNPLPRYTTADASQPWFASLVAQGSFSMDDLVVRTNKPFSAISASSTGYGAIAPAGIVIANLGATNAFSMTASNWYHLASLAVDGGNVATQGVYTFTNVLADHTIAASYAADVASSNTPKWWLYQINTNWNTNFDLAATSDPDNDGMPTWQEYIAGTNPTNPASVFSVNVTLRDGQELVTVPTTMATPQDEGLKRSYSLESCTNLANPLSWQPIPGWTNIQGLGQMITYTNLAGSSNLFFRGKVWLGA